MYISGVLPCKFHNSAFKSKLDKARILYATQTGQG